MQLCLLPPENQSSTCQHFPSVCNYAHVGPSNTATCPHNILAKSLAKNPKPETTSNTAPNTRATTLHSRAATAAFATGA
jgi:hypothetical protein